MLLKLKKHKKLLKASTLMEALVALAITSLMMWMVFSSLEYTMLPVTPDRKLHAIVVADSLLQAHKTQTHSSDTINIKGFTVIINNSPVDTFKLNLTSVKIYATPKHLLISRQQIQPYETKPQD